MPGSGRYAAAAALIVLVTMALASAFLAPPARRPGQLPDMPGRRERRAADGR
jgi:hypothetical protein